METLACLKERRTVRRFDTRAVTDDTLRLLIDGVSSLPSWKNTQIVRYTAVKDRTVIHALAEGATLGFQHNKEIIENAPVLVVLSYVEGRCGYERDGSFTTRKGDRWQMFDAGIAAEAFSLAAWEMGLGSVIMGIFDEDAVASQVSLPEGETVAALIALGYRTEIPPSPPKKDVDTLLRII